MKLLTTPFANAKLSPSRFRIRVTLFLLFIGLSLSTQLASAIGGGGTENSPYTISNSTDWDTFKSQVVSNETKYRGCYWVLTNDITITGQQARIGNNLHGLFTGTFDGGGHTINISSDMIAEREVNGGGTAYMGLFGFVNNATIKDLNISMHGMECHTNSGLLVGEASGNLTIDNVHIVSSGLIKVTGKNWGGFVGKIFDGKSINISASSVVAGTVSVTSTEEYINIGGFVGFIDVGTLAITDCLTDMELHSTSIETAKGTRRMGGFIGTVNDPVTITRCFTGCSIPNPGSTWAQHGMYVGYISRELNGYVTIYSGSWNRNYGRTFDYRFGVPETDYVYTCEGSALITDWLTDAPYQLLERRIDDGDKTIDSSIRGNERWGYDTSIRPQVSKTEYAVQVRSGDNVTVSDGFRYRSGSNCYLNAGETLTITPKSYINHQRVEYSFQGDYLPSSGNAYTATREGDNWLLIPRVNGTVSAEIINIPYPEGVSGSFDPWNNKVTISWKASNPNSLQGKFFLFKRQEGSTGSWTRIDGPTISTNTAGEIRYSQEIVISDWDYDKRWVYAVSFLEAGIPQAPASPYEYYSDSTVVNGDLSSFIAPQSFSAEGGENSILIRAIVPQQLSENQSSCSYTIMRRKDGEEPKPIITPYLPFSGQEVIYEDKDPTSSCVDYYYHLEIKAFNNRTFKSAEAKASITGETKVTSLTATKGEYNNQVRLEWESSKSTLDHTDRYKIFRKTASSADDAWTELATVDTREIRSFYSDDKAMPGVYYRYKVELYRYCNNVYESSNSQEDIGFSQSLGSVSGRITYGSGQSVKDVHVSVVRNDLQVNESQYHSLRSEGRGFTFSWAPEAAYYNNIINGDFTYQFWLNPDASMTGSVRIAELGNLLSIYLIRQSDNSYKVTLRDIGGVTTYLTTSTGIISRNFSHIVIVRKGDQLTCHIVDESDSSATQLKTTSMTRTWSSVTSSSNMGIRMGYDLIGNVDECRFWSRALGEEEIKKDFNRMLTGSEEKLKAYWTFDENLNGEGGQAGYFFDISRVGSVFNRNHGRHNLTGDTIVPLRSQLALKAITDANGNYLIRGIPFSGEGSSYDIVPTLGVHQFNPTSQLRMITNNSLVYDAVDFTDISSFDVSGTVTYSLGDPSENSGNYPVEGCNFQIDGQLVTNADGTAYTSKADGTFEIKVPIGEHTVRVVKMGHAFYNNGELTMPEGGYNRPISDVRFYDLTRVKLIGRVVGGLTENDKPLGFGESVNNTGASTITLMPVRSDKMLTDPVTEVVRHKDGQWGKPGSLSNDVTSVTYRPNSIEIKISPETGEFVAWVFPEAYNIGKITAPGYTEDIFAGNELIDLTTAPVPNDDMLQTSIRTWTDSTFVSRPGQVDYYEKEEKSDTVRYHAKWTTYYQAVPTFSTKQLVDNRKVDYFGEIEHTINNIQDGSSDKVRLWDGSAYLFGKPVFKQGNEYTFAFEAYEEYRNKENEFTYPVDQGTVTLSGTLALEGPSTILLDESGKATYTFQAGAPDLTNGKRSFMGTVKIGNASYYWDYGNSPIEVWNLGDESTGTDFMTSGPNQITAILRDPPGSLSYSYIEKGTSITTTSTNEITNGMKETLNFMTSLGPKVTTFIGFCAGIILESEVKLDISAGINSEQTWQRSGETTQTTTFTERFETSDDPLYVGHLGDVFIGNSTNIQYGLTKGISIYKGENVDNKIISGGGYSIAPSVSLAYGQTFDTRFAYTQVELEEIMIPKWKDNLSILLLPQGTQVNSSVIKEPVYVSNLSHDDPRFGKLNTDKAVFGAEASAADQFHTGKSYTIHFPNGYDKSEFKEDSVMWFNNQIDGWTALLAQNEKEKVDMTKLGNYSLGSGAAIEYSKTESTSQTTTSSFKWMLNPTIGLTTGVDVMGIGLELETIMEYVHEDVSSDSESKETTITSGFVLKEQGDDDEITVDYGMTSSGTMAFKTRGGRTSCPHEGSYVSKYYEEGKHILSEGTMQIEVPIIDIEGPDQVLNVPANKTAKFLLNMKNESETNEDVWFQLIVNEETNPYGAELKIDGGVIGNGRMFLVKAGEELKKTLTVGKGNADSHKNIELILRSECQSDPTDFLPVIADTTQISVQFTPGCSEVNIKSPTNNWIVNTNTNDTLRIVLDGIERDYTNFGYIQLEYRKSSSPEWSRLMNFYCNEELYGKASGNKVLVEDTDTRIVYNWGMRNLEDGSYELRATAVCVDDFGVAISELTSDIIVGIKDMSRPESLGLPAPVNGLLGVGDEIAITFNENIQTGRLTKNNFSITGALNASQIAEPNTGLWFDATGVALTELPISANSFTIGTWFKRTNETAGTLFAYGSSDDFISLGFDESGHAIVTVGDSVQTSKGAISNATNTWKFIGLSYDRETRLFYLYAYQDSDPVIKLFEGESLGKEAPRQGKLYLGNSIDNRSGFQGAVGYLHFYNRAMDETEMSLVKATTKAGTEPNLIGYWELNEAEGTWAKDKALSRNLTVNTGWYIHPAGRGLSLNGNQYATLPSGEFPFCYFDDFTVELQFRGDSQAEATLLSMGLTAYVGFDANHNLTLSAGDKTQILTSNNLLDGNWHHLALAVKRNGMTTAIVDGVVTTTFSSNIFKDDVGGGNYWLGVHYEEDQQLGYKYTRHFKGNVDEVRVWNTALSTAVVKENKKYKLRGDEKGLVSYYPFEKWTRLTDGTYHVDTLTTDLVDKSRVMGGMAQIGNTAAAVLDAPLVVEIRDNYSFVASDNKIVFNITEELYRLEGVTLDISVEDVLDMYGNKSKPAKWQAYVTRNPLNWLTDQVDLVMEYGSVQSFQATIQNQAATAVDYYIEELPGWLSVNAQSGTLQPLATKELTFTVASGTNIGDYEAALALIGTNNIRKVLPVALKVTGQRPDWSVDRNEFEQTMSVTGQLRIEGVPQEDEADILAAFIGERCVGIASPKYESSFNAYFLFMTIGGNVEDNEQPIHFKLWDASTGNTYPVIELSKAVSSMELTFVGDDNLGTPEVPVYFNARDIIEQSIALHKGWNWISAHVMNDNPALIDQFKANTQEYVVQVKAGDGAYMTNTNGNWLGALDALSVEKMYVVKADKAGTLTLLGGKAKPDQIPITLEPGKWTWIGYTPQATLPVSEALAGIPNPTVNDVVKGQNSFRILSSSGWIGSLMAMEPGRGYKYKSENRESVEFHYPNASVMLRSSSLRKALSHNSTPAKWMVDYSRFNENMILTASLYLQGKEILDGQFEIAAFCGNECRGSIQMESVEGLTHSLMGFLMVHGETNEVIDFRIYDHANGLEYKTDESLIFQSDAIHGSPDKAFALHAGSPTGMEEMTGDQITIFPNPIEEELFIRHNRGVLERVEIVDVSGKVLIREENMEQPSINVADFNTGTYLIYITVEGQRFVNKFIKK